MTTIRPRRFPSLLGLVLLASLPLLACGSSAPPDGTLNGSWEVVEEVDAGECDDGIEDERYQIVLQEKGGGVLVKQDGEEFAATRSGNEVAWTAIFDEDGGTTTSLIQVRFDEARREFQGFASWTWEDGEESCSGTSELSGSRG